MIDGQWRPASNASSNNINASSDNNSLNNGLAIQANFSLDKEPLALPVGIEPFVKALLVKSNSIIIYWEDIAYVRPITNPAYQQKAIESDLLILKENLERWALQMQKQL